MAELITAIFGPKLNFKNFRKVKHVFLQAKLNIDPNEETNRICRKDVIITNTCVIEPIDLEIENYE